MQHLGPIKTRGAGGISPDQNQPSQSTFQGGDNSQLNQTFEALQAERSRIRAQISPNQAQLDEAQANATRYTRISSDELNAGQVAAAEEVNYNLEFEESSFEADLLNKESNRLEKQAEESEGPEADFYKSQAEQKKEEAKEEEEKARLASMNAEIARDEVSRRMQAYRGAEQSTASSTADATNSGNQVRALQSQDSALGTRLSGSRASSGNKLSGSRASTGSNLGGARVPSPSGGYTSIDWAGGGYGFHVEGTSPALAYYFAAVALLGVIGKLTRDMMGNASPVVQISKNLTVKGMSEQAIAYLEAALVDSTLQGTPVNQQIILRKAQASALHGDAETNIAFWKEAINENKQLLKQTQDLAKSA